MASLEGVKLKIDWASHHFDLLRAEVADYVHTYPPKFVIKRENPRRTEAWGIFKESHSVPSQIPLIFGDVLQTVHSSLDYLICELIRTGNEEPTTSNQFPVADSRAVFDEEIGRKRLRGVPFEAVAIIEGLQPYHAGENAQKSPLFALKTLTNIHKHRNILLAALGTSRAPADAEIVTIDAKTYTFSSPLYNTPLDLDAEVGPFIIDGPNVKMEGKFGAVVVLTETLYKGCEITSFIGRICLYVRDTLIPKFERFF